MNPTFHRRMRMLTAEVLPVLRGHYALAVIVLGYAALTLGLTWNLATRYDGKVIFVGFVGSVLAGPIFALCGYAIYIMLFIRPSRLTLFLLSSVRAYLTRARLLHALPVLVLLPVFATCFTILKGAIPFLHPFAWDRRLSELDLALHGGVAPWEWLHQAISAPLLTAIINGAYHLWFFIMFALLYWLAFTMDRPRLRSQFLLSFVLSWFLLGTLLAIAMSSAGPCFYGRIVDRNDPYAQLLQQLHQSDLQVKVLALDVQDLLWNEYQDKSGYASIGISAMPSMHVATSVLLALAGWQINRAAGIALSLFALVILVGSVHLGWHYAVDGYAGAAGAGLIWLAVGGYLKRSEARP
ncbi:MAG: phosphatase PAP2 family protein [Pseudomonadota bacterium]